MDELALYHKLLADERAVAALVAWRRKFADDCRELHRERVRSTLAAVEERIRTRRAENEAHYRERLRRAAAAAAALEL